MLVGTANGNLTGTGVWRFSENGGVVVVDYEWRVATQKEGMNLLAPLARPLFRWNHDQVMRWGEAGLARYIEQQYISFGQAQS